jgi:hypothetical protein
LIHYTPRQTRAYLAAAGYWDAQRRRTALIDARNAQHAESKAFAAVIAELDKVK